MTRYQPIALCHYGMAQRWLVVSSQAAIERAEKSVNKAQERECEAIQKHLFHLQKRSAGLLTPRKPGRWRRCARPGAIISRTTDLIAHQCSAGKGRPPPSSPVKSRAWPRQAQVRVEAAVLEANTHHRACSVIGTHSAASHVSDGAILRASTSPSHAESGCRFLQDPLCFVSSLFVKKPRRMQGVLRVMTFAFLVYAVTQRR
jgi:hypothetical protein